MSLQTGGRAVGATSTRSRSASCASRSASLVATMPTVSPLGPTSRTSGTRIRSLMRRSVLMGPPGGGSIGQDRRGNLSDASGGSAETTPETKKGFRDDERKPHDRTGGATPRPPTGGDHDRNPTTCAVGAGGRANPPLVFLQARREERRGRV